MFSETKKKLIVMYSGLILTIMVAMVLLFYLILSRGLMISFQNQLSDTSKQLETYWIKIPPSIDINNPKRKIMLEEKKKNGIDFSPGEEYYIQYSFVPLNQFFVLQASDGSLMLHSLENSVLLASIQTAAGKWIAGDHTMTFQDQRTFQLRKTPLKDGTFVITGIEVTENFLFLRQMSLLLTGLALVFVVLSIALGYWFSGKAMIPIQRSYKRQQEFVSDASHELRTPLSILHTSVEILEEEEQALPEYHRKVLADMKRELSRMTRLIDDLLALARSDSGQLEILRQPFDLKHVIESTVLAFSLLSDKHRISLSCEMELTDGDPIFLGDEERLKQLLYILLDNALKYNKPRGAIRLVVKMTAQELQIGVADTGIGIPSEDLPHIFDRFYRVHKGRSRSSGGVGLGLSIASWIVNSHGGHIGVNSRMGDGTTVTVTLPRK